tara:strand:+ start:116 stop:433 length:318 start_codon:yes stop_codon:yes gene_type:complete
MSAKDIGFHHYWSLRQLHRFEKVGVGPSCSVNMNDVWLKFKQNGKQVASDIGKNVLFSKLFASFTIPEAENKRFEPFLIQVGDELLHHFLSAANAKAVDDMENSK